MNMKTALVNEPVGDVAKLASGLKWVSVTNEGGFELFCAYYTEAKDKKAAAKQARKLLAKKVGVKI